MLLQTAVLLPLSLVNGSQNAVPQVGSTGDLQLLELPMQPGVAFDVAVMIDGVYRDIRLEPWSMRAPGFQLLAQGTTGALEEWPAPAPRTYRGEVRGIPGSVVTASLGSDGLRATLWGLDGQIWEVAPAGGGAEHVVQPKRLDPMLACGVLPTSRSDGGHRGGSFVSADSATMICEIAIDCDYEQYLVLGADALPEIESLMNEIAPPFETDLGIEFVITAIVLRTSQGADPYQGYGSSLGTLQQIVTSHWEANHQEIPRDMVHLFTQKTWDEPLAGMGDIGGVCSCLAYSVSKSLPGCGPCSTNPFLLAHELGHVLGAHHCNGEPECWIMCTAGCTPPIPFSFGSYSTNEILNGFSNLACLTAALPSNPPTLTSINPSETLALAGTPLTITGTGLADTKGIRLVTPWGQIHEDLCSAQIVDDTTILFTPPTALALGTVQLSALSGPGSSNAVTFEYVPVDPPQLATFDQLCIPVSSSATLPWDAWSEPGLLAVLLTSYNNPATTTVGGFTVLANGSSTVMGTLDSLGHADYSRAVPAQLAGGVLYSQLALYNSVSSLVGVSAVQSTPLALDTSPQCSGSGG